MNTYFERLEEIIKRHEQEIDHLNAERNALRQEERNMPLEEFNREYQKIINYLENETRSLNEAQTTLESYHYNYDKSEGLIRDLRVLRDELTSARDDKDEDDINEEITRKEEELRASISLLPLEMADYLRNSFLTQDRLDRDEYDIEVPTNGADGGDLPEEVTPEAPLNNNGDTLAPSLDVLPEVAQNEYDAIQVEIDKLSQSQVENDGIIQESTTKLNDIMQEEQAKYEEEGLLDSEDLNKLQVYYMGLKEAEKITLQEAKRKKASLSRKIRNLEKKQAEIIEINNFAKENNISYEESKVIFSSMKNKKIKNALEQRGLGDIIHKSSRTKAEKETYKKAQDEIKDEIINFHKTHQEMNIKDIINVLYGMDNKVSKVKEPRKTKVSKDELSLINSNVKQLPAVVRKDDFIQKNKDEASKWTTPKSPLELPAAVIKDDSKQDKNIQPQPKDTKDDKDTKNNSDKDNQPQKNKIEPPKKKESIKVKRGLREIIGDLRKDLYVGKKDGSRYRRSNLKVSQNFVKELQSGNTLYNIVHVVPATIKASIQLLGKLSGKIMLSEEAKEMMQTLETRVDNLSAEDLETIYREYRGNRINQERYPQALNMVIEKKVSEYILGKVTVINNKIEGNYACLFRDIQLLKELDGELRKGKLSIEKKTEKLDQRNFVLEDAADSIKAIRELKVQADNLLSGGLHGLSEDMKAAATKLNCVGMRFTKEHDLDNELEDALMDCEKRENKAIAEQNDEELLKAFIESEMLLSKNTEISYSIFGKRSTGKKYYSPLAEQLNYSNDPFIRDLFSTIAVATSVISAVNASNNIKAHQEETEQLLVSEKEILDKVHKAGEEITSKKGAMYEGMRAQANQDVLTNSGTIERATLDANGWALGTDAYHAADKAGHAFTNNFYNSVQDRFASVSQAYTTKAIDEAGALQELIKISNDSHATLVNVTDKCLEILRPYAQNNPQFDLAAAQDAMQYIVDHPDAIANMNQAMADVQNVGEQLLNISQTNIETISNLPGNLGTTIASAASACALASRVSSTMNTTRKARYGNAVTDMVDEYSEQLANEESEKTR